MSAIKGFKGGSGSSHTPVEAPDSLHSIAYARILDLVSEGPIQGFTHGTANCLQDIYLNETPVANSDNSLNFKNVKIDSRTGTQDQLVMSGFPDVENATAVNLELKSTTPWTQSLTNLALSAVRITLSVPALQKSNTSNGDIQGYTIQYAIDVQTDGGSFYQVITSAFTGKTTSKYQRNHRIDLPPATTGWTIRVRRLTANQNLATIQDVVMVDSYTQIIDALLRYPNSAYVGLIVDSSQFSAIPDRAYDLMGRIIQVPSNYDPVARTYTGAWDGTFKAAWTNNPAWIFYDLATHPRYGLGQYVTAAQINKWNLYTIAQYCDALVPNGFGGTEPRFTCSLFLQKEADAYKVLQDLASVFRGISFWAGGSIQASADMPSSPVYTYTAANVSNAKGGKFTYAGSKRTTRYTVALVSWNDPNDFGRAKVKYVPDTAGIARYGVRVTKITGVGCTSEGQALRVGLWTLLTSRLETETVTFKVGLDATVVAPGQVIRVADPARAGRRQAGRINAATSTSVTVDSLPTVAIGDNLTVTLPSGVTETHAVTGIAGKTISIASPGFSAMPVVESVWVCESSSLQAALYRVISVLEDRSSAEISFTITALLHNDSKFAAIDYGAPITVPPISVVPPSSQATPTNLILEAFPTAGQVLASTLLIIQWDDTPNAVYYDVKWRKDNGNWQPMGRQYGLTIDLPNAAPGVYQAMVIAVNGNGVSSLPAISAPYTVNDQTTQPGFAQTLATEVAAAQSSANSANAELANIASDNKVTSAEKPTVIRDWSVISSEQAGIDAQAVSFLGAGSAQQVAYDNAITALANYLGSLTTPTMWNDKSGDTTVVGSTFRQNFNSVYITRQTLLNAIYAKAQNLANNAQSTANTANTTANNAQPAAIVNPGFDQGMYGWTPESDAANWYAETGTNGPNAGTSTYLVHRGSTTTTFVRNMFHAPVVPGQVIKATCKVKGLSSPTGQPAIRILFQDISGNDIASPASPVTGGAVGNGTQLLSVIGTAPANAAFATISPGVGAGAGGYYNFDDMAWTYQANSIDEVPDGATYQRMPGANMDGNRRGLVDFAQGGHVNKNVDNIGDGSTYGRLKLSSMTGNDFDFAKGGVNKQLDNVGDGAVYMRMPGANMDTGRRALVDFSQGGHVNKNMDNVADGATYGRMKASSMTGNDFDFAKGGVNKKLDYMADSPAYAKTPVMGGSAVVVPNANFQAPLDALGGIPGWVPYNGATISYYNGIPPSGAAQVLHTTASGSTPQGFGAQSQNFKCTPGDTFYVRTYAYAETGAMASAIVIFFSAANAYLGSFQAQTTAYSAWQSISASGVAPAGAAYCFLRLGNPNTGGGSSYFYDVHLTRAANLDNEAVDGSVNGRMAMQDAFVQGGANRVGLRVAGSGHQIGDQRNLKQRTVTNIPAKVPTTISYSAAAGSPATATITVGAFTVLNGSVSTSYNASSASVTGTGGTNVNYFLYMNDPGFAGGAQTLIATTNGNDVYAGDGYVYVGTVTVGFPSSGSGSGSGGGGGGGSCVCAHMWLDDETRADEAEPGYLADCIDIPATGLHKFRRRLRGMEMSTQSCVRLTTVGGAVLECSAATPFDLPSGGSTSASDMKGREVVTDKGVETVTEVLHIGEHLVCHQHYGGISYAAGVDPAYRIYSHNALKP